MKVSPNASGKRQAACLVVAFFLPLIFLFHGSLDPSLVLFSNDGPLGAMAGGEEMKWSNFHGAWQDLNSIGNQAMSNSLSIHQFLDLVVNSVVWAKFFAPLALLMLGLAAGFCFRRLGLSHLASVLGALAVMLNTTLPRV